MSNLHENCYFEIPEKAGVMIPYWKNLALLSLFRPLRTAQIKAFLTHVFLSKNAYSQGQKNRSYSRNSFSAGRPTILLSA